MAATLDHAENLFVAGDYEKASAVLRRSAARNRRYAPQYPLEVASLYRAGSRMAGHVGQRDQYRIMSLGVVGALKEGLPATSREVIAAEIESTYLYLQLGDAASSVWKLQKAADRAERAGQPDLAALARLRAAVLMSLTGDQINARSLLRKIAEGSNPRFAAIALMAKVELARTARKKGEPDPIEALLADVRSRAGQPPVLIYEPEINVDAAGGARGNNFIGSVTNQIPMENFGKTWVDIGFRVTPQGSVDDVEILRQQGSITWIKPVLASIEGRRYAPLATGETGAGSYRIERYTYTSWIQDVTGSRIAAHAPGGRLERIDLTLDGPPPPLVGSVQTLRP